MISKHVRNGAPTPVYRLAPVDLAWVAGLLEGEGCFSHKSGASSPRGITVQCHMTDLDVLKRLHRKVKVGHVRGPYANGFTRRPKKGVRAVKCKPRWMFQVSGPAAYQLMKQLLPLMGVRRTARIRELLKGYESVKAHVFKMVHVKSKRIETTTDLKSWLKAHKMSNNGLYRTFIGERAACRGWKRLA